MDLIPELLFFFFFFFPLFSFFSRARLSSHLSRDVREMKDEKRKTHACNNNHDSKRFKKKKKKGGGNEKETETECAECAVL